MDTVHYRRSTQYSKAPCGIEITATTPKTGRVDDVTCRVCLMRVLAMKRKEVRRIEDRLGTQ